MTQWAQELETLASIPTLLNNVKGYRPGTGISRHDRRFPESCVYIIDSLTCGATTIVKRDTGIPSPPATVITPLADLPEMAVFARTYPSCGHAADFERDPGICLNIVEWSG